jgi:hypothetical protein
MIVLIMTGPIHCNGSMDDTGTAIGSFDRVSHSVKGHWNSHLIIPPALISKCDHAIIIWFDNLDPIFRECPQSVNDLCSIVNPINR